MRLRGLRWTGWNGDTATGRGELQGHAEAKVTLSSPRECATLDGFIYTRARIVTPARTYARIPIACPLPCGVSRFLLWGMGTVRQTRDDDARPER